MAGGPSSPDSALTRAEFEPSRDDPLRTASPLVDDVERRRARSAIESKLFSGPRQPVRVGRYRIAGRIGSGGMGVVYRAHDPELARDVAVKVVNPETGSGQEHARARLVREARAMARLAHPNVIHVYDVGTIEDGVFIAMELVEGRSLAAWLQDDVVHPWREILRLFVDAGRGLAAAHAAGVIHRDFKPHNVLVGSDGRVRVGDFGLAGGDSAGPTGPHDTLVEADSDEIEEPAALDRASISGALTRTGMLLGTPKYMAPEQESGAPASARSDQFSFCVALYEALYGRTPFAGETVTAYRRNVRLGRVLPPPPDTRVKAWVHTEIVRGLAVDPAGRHPGMDALLDRLDAAIEDPRAIRRRRRRYRIAAIGSVLFAGVGFVTWKSVSNMQVQPVVVAADMNGDAKEPDAVTVMVPIAGPVIERAAEAKAEVASEVADADPPDKKTTAKPSSDALKTRPRPAKGRGSCYLNEHNLDLIARSEKYRKSVRKGSACWICDVKAKEHQIATLNVQDCAAYYICHTPEPDEQCTE